MRQTDWGQTPLGPVESWPDSLRTAVRILLTSRQPMFVWWGEQLINLYNDAYAHILGGKHPGAFGQPAEGIWKEIWGQIEPRVRTALTTQTGTFDESLLLVIERHGYPEESYFTFSYSPLPKDDGEAGGIFCACNEDTGRIWLERQLALLQDLAARTADARSRQDASRLSALSLATNPQDFPFALIYLFGRDRQSLFLTGASGIEVGHPAAPPVIALGQAGPWPMPQILEISGESSGEASGLLLIDDLGSRFPGLPGGAWDTAPRLAVAIPIPRTGQNTPAGVMIAGLSPYRRLDDNYGRLLGLVSRQIGAAIANAEAYETERQRADRLAALDQAKTLDIRQLRHSEEALRKSEARFRGMAEDSPVMLWVAEPDGSCTFLSKNWYEFTGQTPDTGLDFGWLEAAHPEDRERLVARYREAVAEHRAFRTEFRLRTRDGSYRWVIAAAVPRSGPERDFLGWVGSLFDIHEHRLEADDRQFLIDLGTWMAAIRDPDAISAGVTKRLGERLQVALCTFAEINLDREMVTVQPGYSRGVRSQGGVYPLSRFGTAGIAALQRGRVLKVDNTAGHPLLAPFHEFYQELEIGAFLAVPLIADGKLTGIFGVTSEMPRTWTPREAALVQTVAYRVWHEVENARLLRALRYSEEQFRTLADNISQLAWMTDRNGSPVWYNRRWYDYTGTGEREMQAGWSSVLHPDHRSRVLERYRASVTEVVPWEDTFPIRSKEGTWRWFLSRALPIFDNQGNVLRWFGTNTDVTEQLETERALRRANQDLEQFAFSASHDLQEPLRNVSIYSELLAQALGKAADPRVQHCLHVITDGSQRMLLLVRDLLSYIEVTGAEEEKNPRADAAEVLRKVVSSLGDTLLLTKTAVEFGDLPVVRIPEARLLQLFQNLISNAVKYRRPDVSPRIVVRAEPHGGWWLFSVADNGIGIPDDYTTYIFGVFKRLHSGPGTYPGTGIGLAICQKIVERYGGRIWAESKVGEGTTFWMTLPA